MNAPTNGMNETNARAAALFGNNNSAASVAANQVMANAKMPQMSHMGGRRNRKNRSTRKNRKNRGTRKNRNNRKSRVNRR
jgi:hypothetical protein